MGFGLKFKKSSMKGGMKKGLSSSYSGKAAFKKGSAGGGASKMMNMPGMSEHPMVDCDQTKRNDKTMDMGKAMGGMGMMKEGGMKKGM